MCLHVVQVAQEKWAFGRACLALTWFDVPKEAFALIECWPCSLILYKIQNNLSYCCVFYSSSPTFYTFISKLYIIRREIAIQAR